MKFYKNVSLMALFIIFLFINISSAFAAYSPSAAIQYADTWATSHNPNYPDFVDNDCTNFVSQAVHAGGVAFDKSGIQWYCEPGILYGWNYSSQWTVAQDFYNWIVNDSHGYLSETWDENGSTGYPQPPGNSANLTGGEVISLDWTSDGRRDHSGIVVVNNGYDSDSTWSGDLADYHSNSHYHAIWHLIPYNSYWTTTTQYGLKIN